MLDTQPVKARVNGRSRPSFLDSKFFIVNSFSDFSFCAQGIGRTGMRIRPMTAVYRAFDSYKRDYKARLLHSCDKIDMD